MTPERKYSLVLVGWATPTGAGQLRNFHAPPMSRLGKKAYAWRAEEGPSQATGNATVMRIRAEMCTLYTTPRIWERIWRTLADSLRSSYRPEKHYMRGPGPKWRAKHQQ